MSLHAASKPLMKFLYHRQVLDFIKKKCGTPLSQENLQTFSDYLAFKYLSPATKVTILEELRFRLGGEHDARALVHSPVLHQVVALLGSPEAKIRRCMPQIVGKLAVDEFTAMAVLSVNPCVELVALLQ
ncbi:hypothetical protein C8R44DRAFT_865861 [Mycena epipterygia]|nr:hypothetical protein C8R44DRAFT_865861 [Mycena epipterygia]